MKTALRRVWDYPFTHAVAAAMITSAAGLLPLGGPAVLCLAFSAMLSGLLILTGLQWRGARLLSNGILRAGLYLGAGVWAGDIVIVVAMFGFEPLSLLAALLFGAACLIRAIRLGCVAKAHVQQLAADREAVERAAREEGDHDRR